MTGGVRALTGEPASESSVTAQAKESNQLQSQAHITRAAAQRPTGTLSISISSNTHTHTHAHTPHQTMTCTHLRLRDCRGTTVHLKIHSCTSHIRTHAFTHTHTETDIPPGLRMCSGGKLLCWWPRFHPLSSSCWD